MTDTTSPSATTMFADFMAQQAREQASAMARAIAMRATLLAIARAAGATTITATYEGGNDSGAVDAIAVEPETAEAILNHTMAPWTANEWSHDLKAMAPQTRDRRFKDCVEEMFLTHLEARVGNWFDGDIESSGEIVWHVGDDPDRITGEHTLTTRESEWTEWSTEDDDEDEDESGDPGATADADTPSPATSAHTEE
jgi:hypothetical protein